MARAPRSRTAAPAVVARALAYLALLAALLGSVAAAGPGATWELRVCAPPDELPFSNRAGEGFENRIAAILADELGATLGYDWAAFNSDLIDLHFAEGTCDVIMGVPDGFERGSNTLTYYQSPYVMVYRQDATFEIDDMDDPDLAHLAIGVQGLGTPPHEALRHRGLLPQVTRVYGGEEGEARLATLVTDVAAGVIDVGFTWGPVAGYYAPRAAAPLVVKPVEPAFDLPSVFQYVPMTIGVRRDDVAMRARLDRALIARWDDVQAVLEEYGVPRMPLAAPFLGEPAHPAGTLRVGVVLPMPTGGRTRVAGVNDLVGAAARLGALSAEADANAAASGRDVQVVLASSPSAGAAARAAAALLARGEVDALVGGVGAGQAEVLATAAARHGVPFLNVGSTSLLLRQQCARTTFHVQPSAGAYVDAMARLYRRDEAPQAWFVVYPLGPEGAALAARATAAFAAVGDVVVGASAVENERPSYLDVLAEAESAGADVVAVLLGAADQLTLIGQAEDAGLGLRLAPFPDPVTQTREFLAAANRYGVGTAVPRLELWDPALATPAAAALNGRFQSRWGQPLDAPAWATYTAVSALAAAARAADSVEPADLAGALLAPDVAAAGAKGANVAFRAVDHELRQPLYVVTVTPGAKWGVLLSQRLAAGTLRSTLPAATDPTAAQLDELGLAGGGAGCDF